ncbi:hypothetical protein EC396_11230 [Lutibacter sp. HS1-25]|uniref:hypothetical protein n=1 Tax=Lutibacter sp. HS1-25 TaxID=2485000 RepID=UPI001012128E|nr:hypothetical protein [Lutibacter sp. HS1-25]RXP52474.1 hypothetical protein EC396_11230 [Lutibacter sp. HS1-25]
MTKLILKRNSEWNNKLRDYGIYIDDKKIGTIANGETKEFDLDSGNYNINGKIDWCKSPKINFEITENDSKEFEISGYKYGRLISIISAFFALIYFLALYIFDKQLNFLILIVVIGLIYPFYFLTFGKNRYLRIREIK